MNAQCRSYGMMLTGLGLSSVLLGCGGVGLTNVDKKPLPGQPPPMAELPLELPQEKGPRRPVDPVGTTPLSAPGPDIDIIYESRPALIPVAEEHPQVKNELGERYAFIDMEEVPADQCLITKPSETHQPEEDRRSESRREDGRAASVHRLNYYSYTHNVAVHVCMDENQVFSVQRDPREGYQPEEGEGEIDKAIALARSDSRIAQEVQNLHGHAILTSPEEYRYFWVMDEEGFGDRVFWVTFSEIPESLALYFARVDLTTNEVLEAGKEPGPQ